MSSLARLRQTIASLPSSNLSSSQGGTVQISQALNNIVDRAFPSSLPSSSSSASASASSSSSSSAPPVGGDANTSPLPSDFMGSPPLAPPSASAAAPSSSSRSAVAVDSPSGNLGPGEQRALERMTASIERLRRNEAAKQFPLGDKTLRPRHDPHYYRRMVNGVHRAAQGQGRSWWKRFFQVGGEI